MLLAELEIRHSRPVAPTRRVALGFHLLPEDEVPGWSGVLLGGLVAAYAPFLDSDDIVPLYDLIDDVEAGDRVAQPRLRHRFQRDTVGLDRTLHSLVGDGENIWFDFDDRARPEVNVLAAVYAAGLLSEKTRPTVFRSLRKAVVWERPLGAEFVAHVLGDDSSFNRWRSLPTDKRWALRLLGFSPGEEPDNNEINANFRERIWSAHPDHGGDETAAGRRISELTRARQVLFA